MRFLIVLGCLVAWFIWLNADGSIVAWGALLPCVAGVGVAVAGSQYVFKRLCLALWFYKYEGRLPKQPDDYEEEWDLYYPEDVTEVEADAIGILSLLAIAIEVFFYNIPEIAKWTDHLPDFLQLFLLPTSLVLLLVAVAGPLAWVVGHCQNFLDRAHVAARVTTVRRQMDRMERQRANDATLATTGEIANAGLIDR